MGPLGENRMERRAAMTNTCGRCGRNLGCDPAVSVTGVGTRCFPCFNEETARRMGVSFDNTPLQPIELAGHDGVVHRFEMRSMLCGSGHEMIAEEVPRREDGGGYRFAVLGDFEADAWQLFQQLYAKMRRELAVHHLEYGQHGWQFVADRLVGRIEWDPDPEIDGRLPVLVVDGKPLKWPDVGRLLMEREGWTVVMRIEDGIEVVGGPLFEGIEPEDEEG